jgi:hypothetical protein
MDCNDTSIMVCPVTFFGALMAPGNQLQIVVPQESLCNLRSKAEPSTPNCLKTSAKIIRIGPEEVPEDYGVVMNNSPFNRCASSSMLMDS